MAFWRPFECDTNENTSDNPTDDLDPTPMNWEFVNKDLHIQAQRIILNIYSCLRGENSTLSENNIVLRICELTKLVRTTVLRVIAAMDVSDHSVKRQRVGQNLKKIEKATKDVIWRYVYEFYQNNKVPTLEMLKDKLKIYSDYAYKSLDTLRRVLIECGFSYKKLDKRMVIMESTRIVIQRQHYLRKIKEYRDDNRDIVYLDETWFDTHDVVQYGWMDDSKWADVKKELRKMNQSPQLSDVVVQNIRTVIEELNKTDIWKNCVAHVQVKEKEYPTLPPIEPVDINTNDDSSSGHTDSDSV